MTLPSVSVVIAVSHYIDDRDSWLVGLGDQTYGDYEVVILDGLLSDNYTPALERWRKSSLHPERVRYIRLPGGWTRARLYNYGLAHISNDVVQFLGGDLVPSRGMVEAHARYHAAHPEPEAVGIGPSLLASEYRSTFSTWLERSGRLAGAPLAEDTTEVPANFFSVFNSSVKRSFLDAVGGFDETFPYDCWDDFELGLRMSAAGMVSRYLPDAVAEHHHHLTIRTLRGMMRDSGASARLFDMSHDGPNGWDPVAARPPWRHLVGAAVWLLRFAATRTPEARDRVFARILDASFSAGYRAGGSSSPQPG